MMKFSHSKKNQHSNENQGVVNPHFKRSYSRQRSTAHVVPFPLKSVSSEKSSARIVQIRLIFIRIGDIDTLNEKYQADIYYEARWIAQMNLSSLNLTPQQQTELLHEGITVKLGSNIGTLYWTPQLFIENAIGQIGEQDSWLTVKKDTTDNHESLSPSVVRLVICEHTRLKGVFWEKLELNYFPADVQDLTVSISTHHHTDNCILLPDDTLRSSINREAFFDQQEWKLYEHVATQIRETKEEYSFENDDCRIESKKHSVLAVTCRAARRPGYYYWNGFSLILLITVCSFCIFSIPPDLPQSRLQITCTLLLTSVTFRWVVNRSLPTISYLTTLDRYAIISIMFLVALCVWHSVIATLIFLNPKDTTLRTIDPSNTYVHIDRYVFICMFSVYILIHISLLIWLIFVPYKRRREMEYLDRQYAANKHIELEPLVQRINSVPSQPQDIVFRRASSVHMNLPTIRTPVRQTKQSDNITIIPNATTCLPIREESNGASSKVADAVNVNELKDVNYNRDGPKHH